MKTREQIAREYVHQGLCIADALELADAELAMHRQFEDEWKSGKVKKQMEAERDAAIKATQTPGATGGPMGYYSKGKLGLVCKDHTGRHFDSLCAMCRAWGIDRSTYRHRSLKGWPLEKILTTPKGAERKEYNAARKAQKEARKAKRDAAIADNRGGSPTPFDRMEPDLREAVIAAGGTIKAFAKALNRPRTTVQLWIDKGFSYEEIKKRIARPSRYHRTRINPGKSGGIPLKEMRADVRGAVLATGGSIRSFAKALKRSYTTVFYWVSKKIPLSEIKRRCADSYREHPVTDFNGRVFPSIKAVCEEYGIETDDFYRRQNLGWDMRRTLTQPVKRNGCTDHLGRRFCSKAEMCKAWGVSPFAFDRRRENGLSLEQALTLKPYYQQRKKKHEKLEGKVRNPDCKSAADA